MGPAGHYRVDPATSRGVVMSAQRREHFGALANVGAKSPTRPFTPHELKERELMRERRRKHFAADEAVKPWPGPKCGALPREAINVDHAHTPLGQAMFDIACEMRDKGMHVREARGRQRAIKCERLPDGESHLITISDSQWIGILLSKGVKASRRQVQIALKYNLHLWYSLEIPDLRNTRSPHEILELRNTPSFHLHPRSTGEKGIPTMRRNGCPRCRTASSFSMPPQVSCLYRSG